MATEVAEHEFERVSGANSDRVGIHQAASGILIVGEDSLDAMSILFVHCFEDLARYLLR